MRSSNWYRQLKKPAWAPPSWLFGPVWTVLYIIIFVSYGTVFRLALAGELPFPVALPFLLNLLFNLAFTPLQFGLRNNLLALVDIVLVLATLVLALSSLWPYLPWVAIFNLPYLLWTTFATVLQSAVTYLNRN